jgi:hypothetical protein
MRNVPSPSIQHSYTDSRQAPSRIWSRNQGLRRGNPSSGTSTDKNEIVHAYQLQLTMENGRCQNPTQYLFLCLQQITHEMPRNRAQDLAERRQRLIPPFISIVLKWIQCKERRRFAAVNQCCRYMEHVTFRFTTWRKPRSSIYCRG